MVFFETITFVSYRIENWRGWLHSRRTLLFAQQQTQCDCGDVAVRTTSTAAPTSSQPSLS